LARCPLYALIKPLSYFNIEIILDDIFSYLHDRISGVSQKQGYSREAKFSKNIFSSSRFDTCVSQILPTRIEQAGFDVGLRQPELLMMSMVSGLGATGILEQKALDSLKDVGDASAGMTVAANMEGMLFRIDTIVFRRGQVGAWLMSMHMYGDKPVIKIDKLAGKLDGRIVEVSTTIGSQGK
jgi:hypothetical protein